MKKKFLSITMVLVLALSALAGCASDKNSSSPSTSPTASPAGEPAATEAPKESQYGDTGGLQLPLVDKPTTLTWMIISETPVNGKMIANEILKRTGITVDFQAYSSATFQDKLRVTMASGKLPDIFHGLRPAELKKLGQQKAVVAINEYADKLPNFSKLYVEENPWVFKSYGDESGNLFAWPIYNMNRSVNHGMMYRKDVFDELGIQPWTNMDEFYNALVALKKAYPDSYPFASKNKENLFRELSYGWGIGGVGYPAVYDEAKSVWQIATTTDEHKALLDFMKKLYNEGLLDPEFITDTSDSWTAKMTTGKSFVTYDWIGRLDLFYNQISAQNPNYNLRYGFPIGPNGNNKTLPLIESFGLTVANNANKEVALKLLDYLTSPSGAALVTLGIEGETFNFDANGKPVYPELAGEKLIDINTLNDRYGMWLEGMYLKPDRRSVYYNFTEKEQEAQDLIINSDRFEPLDPVLNFTDEENAIIAEYQLNLEKATNEFNTRYVLDKNYGDTQWAEWKKTAESLGASKMLDVYKAAQERYNSAK